VSKLSETLDRRPPSRHRKNRSNALALN